jgi:hypothetical protein
MIVGRVRALEARPRERRHDPEDAARPTFRDRGAGVQQRERGEAGDGGDRVAEWEIDRHRERPDDQLRVHLYERAVEDEDRQHRRKRRRDAEHRRPANPCWRGGLGPSDRAHPAAASVIKNSAFVL